MNWTTVTSRAVAGLVAAVAGFSSYRHIVDVATHAGEHGTVAAVLPLSIDGLIVVGTLAMLEDRRAGRLPRLSARVAIGLGVVATLAANIASARPTTTARLVAAVAPLAFLVAVEVLSRRGRAIEQPPTADLSARGQNTGQNTGQVRAGGQAAQADSFSPADRSGPVALPADSGDEVQPATNGHHVDAITNGQPAWQPVVLTGRTEPDSGQPTDEPRARRTDDEVLQEFSDRLLKERERDGKLTRYRVETVCDLGGRQAARILAAVEARAASPVTQRNRTHRPQPTSARHTQPERPETPAATDQAETHDQPPNTTDARQPRTEPQTINTDRHA